jgi:dTDP-L-rhamnose 4-epimerase
MVVYGEGRYECADHGWVRPGPRAEDDLISGFFEPTCPTCGRALTSGLVTEDAPLDPRNVYASTKLMQEHLAASWARVTGGRAVALRYHNVYGPRLPRDTPYAGVAALFRSALLRDEAPAVFEDGAQRRDFVHVRDVAAANVAVLEGFEGLEGPESRAVSAAFRAYNVGSGTPRTVGDMAAELARALQGPKPIVTGGYRLGDVRHITASSERIRAELGWRPVVAFADGIAEFAADQEAASPWPGSGAMTQPVP